MKVVLDLDELLLEKKISQTEYDKLQRFACVDTTRLAFNILLSFGVIAIVGGLLAMIPTAMTSLVIGILLMLLGASLRQLGDKWQLLSSIILVIAVLLICGGIIGLHDSVPTPWWLVAALLIGASCWLKNGLLAVLSVLTLSAALDVSFFHYHSSYGITVNLPLVTVLFFSALAYATYRSSLHLSPAYSRLMVLASRTSLFLVNMGFWVGSFGGADFDLLDVDIAPVVFSISWALALCACALWAWRYNKRWVLNCCCVFASIHLFTQWFRVLYATPESVLAAGCVLVVIALGIKRLNDKLQAKESHRKQD